MNEREKLKQKTDGIGFMIFVRISELFSCSLLAHRNCEARIIRKKTDSPTQPGLIRYWSLPWVWKFDYYRLSDFSFRGLSNSACDSRKTRIKHNLIELWDNECESKVVSSLLEEVSPLRIFLLFFFSSGILQQNFKKFSTLYIFFRLQRKPCQRTGSWQKVWYGIPSRKEGTHH